MQKETPTFNHKFFFYPFMASIFLLLAGCFDDINLKSNSHPCEQCKPCEACNEIYDGQAICEPRKREAYKQCGQNGQIHWLDSCDNEGRIARECPENSACVNTSKEEAACQCTAHWEGENCSTCPGNWDSEQDCNACRNQWEGENCSICPGKWDEQQDCSVCLGNLDADAGCSTCRNRWIDNDNDCSTCPENWDSNLDCNACLGNFDIQFDCSACKNYWDITTNCTTCEGNWDPDQDCSACLGNWDIQSDCNACKDHWDIATGCTTCETHWSENEDCAVCLHDLVGDNCEICRKYVDVESSDADPDGSSWETAFTTVQKGIDAAADAVSAANWINTCDVWVAKGTYYTFVNNANNTVQLQPNVNIYGGFLGDETELSQRDFNAHVTTLSGQNEIELFGFTYWVSNVVKGADDALLDGFVISDGKSPLNGGGMLNVGVSPTVKNCVFEGNSADSSGGGMHNESNSPTIINCGFIDNSATGGTFAYGGGLSTLDSNLIIENSVFANNEVWGSEGSHGGGLHVKEGYATITNCTFSGNSASSSLGSGYGGGIRHDNTDVTITNSIFWTNSPNEIYPAPTSTTMVTYSVVRGGVQGESNMISAPLFVNRGSLDFHLQSNSRCIDAANGDAAPETDNEGNPRVDDTGTPNTGTGVPPYADIGAYEYQPGTIVDAGADSG